VRLLGLRERLDAAEARRRTELWNRKVTLINCWTLETVSNMRMWDEYGKGPESVAVETDVGTLRSCLDDDCLIAKVQYVRQVQNIVPSHSLEPFLMKRLKFAWEKEVRVIAQPRGAEAGEPRLCEVDLNRLIKKILLHPNAADQFADHITNLVQTLSVAVEVPKTGT
jgi:hypothetical protein